jgi:hypothetical protein
MRKPQSQKRQAVKTLRIAIREGRKVARQINRKLDSLAQWNRIKAKAKEELVKLCLK